MTALTTVDNVKKWLGISGTTDDGMLSRLVTAVSTAIESFLSRSLAQATYTETRDGNGRRALMLGNYPVTAVASVTVDGTAIPARTSPAGNGYFFDDKFLYL